MDDASPREIEERKRTLRQASLAARARVPEAERRTAAAAVAAQLTALVARSEPVLGYAATATELDLDPWLEGRLGQRLATALPRVVGAELEVVVLTALADLAPGWRGLREPTGAQMDPAAIVAAVVPGVAFDAAGGRLGHGGGHIDRLLAHLRPEALVIGVCFNVQLAPVVPMAAHDRRVDLVVTEHGVVGGRADGPAALHRGGGTAYSDPFPRFTIQ